MSMSTMSNRLQVLLDDERRERLERVSRETGAPVSELVRRAIDRAYPADRHDRQQALADFLALEPMPVGEWEDMKTQMRDELSDPNTG